MERTSGTLTIILFLIKAENKLSTNTTLDLDSGGNGGIQDILN